ncbi:PyK [Trypoxylus dichotomus]
MQGKLLYGDVNNHLKRLATLDIGSERSKQCLSGIVCTIGPATTDADLLVQMMRSGMTIARLNFSHGSHLEHSSRIDVIRRALELYKEAYNETYPLAIALDTKGPEIRTGTTEQASKIKPEIKSGTYVTLTTEPEYKNACTNKIIYIDYHRLPDVVKVDDRIYIDDGKIILKCTKIGTNSIECKVINGGTLGNKKGVNLPGIALGLPAISEQDKKDLELGVRKKIDMVFASFIHTAQDIIDIRNNLGEAGKDILVIAKIERQEALDNIDAIIDESDGIMVARGDLALQIPVEKVFLAQKSVIAKCNLKGKPVICATQMLESMMGSQRPSRPDVSDISNAILDGADCVMLSGETAVGKFPVECVKTMERICREAETAVWNERLSEEVEVTLTDADQVSAASVVLANMCNAPAIMLGSSSSEQLSGLVSKYRPRCPILAVTKNLKFAAQIGLYRGVVPLIAEAETFVIGFEAKERLENVLDYANRKGFIEDGNRVIFLEKGESISKTCKDRYIMEMLTVIK